jgi:hypothetical protein
MNHIAWLVEKILEFNPSLWTLSVKNEPDITIDQWLAIRIKWGIDLGFVWFEFDRNNIPQKAICFRPVNEKLLERIDEDYGRSIWDYDPNGRIVFIDFRYGEGSIPFVWDLCRSSGRKEVAYHHHLKMRRVRLQDVPRVKEFLHG